MFLRSDEGGPILVASFYGCPEYVSRISIVMLCDFRVWTPSWIGWPTGTSPRSEVIVNLSCFDIGMLKYPHISGDVLCSCSCWLLGLFLRCVFSNVIEEVLIRTSESFVVVCFVGNRHYNSPPHGNSPFPSCCMPQFQSDSWCTTIQIEMSCVFLCKSNSFPLQ